MAEKKIIISEKQIQSRVKELGEQMTNEYKGRKLVVLGILNGAFIFLADLVRAIDLPLEIDFVRASSYGDATFSSGEIRFSKDVEISLAGKDVLIVEDIVDTGRTLKFLMQVLQGHQPNSLKVCSLIDKKERREEEVVVDFVGFDVQEGFLIGYGLDCAQQYRNLPEIFHLQED